MGIGRTRGTYVLVLRLTKGTRIRVGKLGEFLFPAGYYLYVGSAHGSGGLVARVSRHCRAEKKLHWHVDYLMQHARLEEVWYVESPQRLECVAAEAISALANAGVVAPRFGSSDCRCSAHLLHFSAPWNAQQALTSLRSVEHLRGLTRVDDLDALGLPS